MTCNYFRWRVDLRGPAALRGSAERLIDLRSAGRPVGLSAVALSVASVQPFVI